tara:strand:+ start:642 stop:1049 length:408 start_codon:yes stop_codon:yes gene_type:complete
MSTHWMDNNDWKREAEYETIHETYKVQAHGEMIDELKQIEVVYRKLIDTKSGFIKKNRKGLALELLKQAWSLGYYIYDLPDEEPFDTVEYEFDEEIDEYLNENMYPCLLGDDISNKAAISQNLLGEMYGKGNRND